MNFAGSFFAAGVVWVLLILDVFCSAGPQRSIAHSNCNVTECGELLMLSPFLKKGLISEAKLAAKVAELAPGIDSFSGFLTVNEQLGSNMFFWFFPALTGKLNAPILLWLDGGPGVSDLNEIFTKYGPLSLGAGPDWTLTANANYWLQDINVIYLDNPVGCGLSFTRNVSDYAFNEDTVGHDGYSAVYQFFQLFPEYRDNDFFIAGSSYAGKFVPAVAHTIHQNNRNATVRINLKGIAIGNGLIDPINQFDYSDYLYNIGLIDETNRVKFAQEEEHIRTLIKKRNYAEACASTFNYIADPDDSLFRNVTGMTQFFNYLEIRPQNLDLDILKYLNTPATRKQIHAGKQTINLQAENILDAFKDGMMSSIAWRLEVLMDHYRVLLYYGQLDIICPYVLGMNVVRKLRWEGASEYEKATRVQWYVGEDLAGYAKTAGNFTEVLVRNAGHGVPSDQPIWARDLMMRFVKGQSFSFH